MCETVFFGHQLSNIEIEMETVKKNQKEKLD